MICWGALLVVPTCPVVTWAQTTAPATIQLSLNENPYGPSPKAVMAMEEVLPRLGRYVPSDAVERLTQDLARREGVSPEQILLGDLLAPLGYQLGLRGGTGSEFVYSVPGYAVLVNAALPAGGVVVEIPLNARLENDLPAMLGAITSRTQAIFAINPHNPSGTVSDAAEFHRFLTEASRRTLVIVDEAYLDYLDDFAERTAVAHTRAGENVLVFRTFDKFFAMAGASLGYAVAPRPLADFLRTQGLGSRLGLSSVAVAGAAASIHDRAYADSLRVRIRKELRLWNRFMDEHRIEHTASVGNFVFLKAGRPQQEVAAALTRDGISIGRNYPPLGDWTRITIGLPEENAAARESLLQLLSSMNRK